MWPVVVVIYVHILPARKEGNVYYCVFKGMNLESLMSTSCKYTQAKPTSKQLLTHDLKAKGRENKAEFSLKSQ